MDELTQKSCKACEGGVAPLSNEESRALLQKLDGWSITEEQHLHKEFTFPDFASALEFVNAVGAVAEAEGHHPNIFLTWGKAGIDIWTHSVDALTENDYILAAKIDAL